jgi:MFS family permease
MRCLMRRRAAAHRSRRANLYELAVIAGMAVSADAAGAIATAWDWRISFGLAAAEVLSGSVLQLCQDREPLVDPVQGPALLRVGARQTAGRDRASRRCPESEGI